MKTFSVICIAIFLSIKGIAQQTDYDYRVLVFSKTTDYRHDNIPEGIEAIQELGVRHQFHVDTTEDARYFNHNRLKQYDVVVFLSTSGDILNDSQKAALRAYMQNDGGFVGIHSASACEYNWSWYGKLVGAYFNDHPDVQEATIQVTDREHISTRHLPEYWTRVDEWYNFKSNPRDQVNVLAVLEESTYDGGTMGDDHPIAWYHEFGGGRSWYTALGHTKASFSESNFLKHIMNGILYAAGKNEVEHHH